MYKISFIRNVLPSDVIHEEGIKSFGIIENKATIVGQLCRVENTLFVRSKTENYQPEKFDVVVGKVFNSSNEIYRVDVSGYNGILPNLSFRNATKKSRPELQKGDLVLAQIEEKTENELLLSCKGESLGRIEEAFEVSPWKIRMLCFSKILVEVEGDYKIGLGMNGYIYIEGESEIKEEILLKVNKMQEGN
ncbi:rrp40 [Nucleospora cyclopteri]